MNQIPGVSLAVFWNDRSMPIEDDGYVGEFCSGTAEIQARIEPGLPFYGMFREGSDTYVLQKDRSLVAGLNVGTKLYRARMPIEANGDSGESFVAPPNNLLCLAELVLDGSSVTNRVRLWKVALVSQAGQFFLVTEIGYDTVCGMSQGAVQFPRFRAHQTLNDALVRLRPDDGGVVRFPRIAEVRPDDGREMRGLGEDHFAEVAPVPSLSAVTAQTKAASFEMSLRGNEGLVERFFSDTGKGVVQTLHGSARVHWIDCPRRPRRAFLLPGEQIRYQRIGTPKPQTRDTYSLEELGLTPRVSTSFKYQVYGVEVIESLAPSEAA